jgi:endonuclease/exonuclease/phosphatase family metal-dependent hydrolase
LTAHHQPVGVASTSAGSSDAPRFDTTFRYDLDADNILETIRFSKPPLELAITTNGGTRLRLIAVHAKSKNPYGAVGREAQIRLSIQNRRKQLAQCLWLRQRVEGHLAAKDSLLVMGDFNDGPGIDEYEKLFGHSGIEIVLGAGLDPALKLTDPHASMALQSKVGLTPTSARFYLAPQKRFFEALLDFIMVSPDLAAKSPDWRIWHPFNDPKIMATPDLREALLQASDHFPVSIDLPDVI